MTVDAPHCANGASRNDDRPGDLWPAVGQSFRKLDPRLMVAQPGDVLGRGRGRADNAAVHPRPGDWRGGYGFPFQINLWLWFTVLFANFAEAVAEGRGKAQAATLRRAQDRDHGQALSADGRNRDRSGDPLKRRCRAGRGGDIIPSDGEVIEGVASVNEAAITGEARR